MLPDGETGVTAPSVATAITENRLLGGRVVLCQPASGYRAAIDPVLLAAAVPALRGERVLDLGCGVGAAALCLAARVPDCRIVGLELQPDLAALARHNAAANGVAHRFAVIEGDVRRPPPELAAAAASETGVPGFDHVMMNPPFLPAGAATPPPEATKALAHQEGAAALEDWIAAACRLLKPRGGLTLIHRADRVDAICAALRPRFGAVELIPLWPKPGRPARRLVVRARKDARSPAVLAFGLVLHRPEGGFTEEAEAILRGGKALPA